LDNDPEQVPVVVVDEDQSAASRSLISAWGTGRLLRLQTETELDAALYAVRGGNASAYVYIPTGFSDALENGRETRIVFGADRSRRESALIAEAAVNEGVRALTARWTDPVRAPRISLAKVSVQKETVARGSGFDLVFPIALLWGLMGCSACFAVAVVSERTTGALLRLRAAPTSRAAILAGKSLACASACVLDVILITVIAVLAFGLSISSVGAFAVTALCTALCFTGITMLLGVLGKTEKAVAGAGWASLVVLAMLGGAMVPVALMPHWLRDLSGFSPVRWAIFALEGASWRALPPAELVLPCVLLLGVGAAGLVVGALKLSRETM
jgi:ABC-type multidrug transport system permease subunit